MIVEELKVPWMVNREGAGFANRAAQRLAMNCALSVRRYIE